MESSIFHNEKENILDFYRSPSAESSPLRKRMPPVEPGKLVLVYTSIPHRCAHSR
jgi:hypothetical protein